MPRDTAKFLKMLNEDNERIAARLAEENKPQIGDPVRIAADQERRRKWGTLRAREHTSKRPNQGVFAYYK